MSTKAVLMHKVLSARQTKDDAEKNMVDVLVRFKYISNIYISPKLIHII